jgi:hypothetical protein
MNVFQKTSNIYETFSPFYYIFKVFGLVSFSFQGPIRNGNIKSSFMDKIFPIVISGVHFFSLSFVLGASSVFYTFMTKFLSIAMHASYLINITTNFISIVGLYTGRQKFIKFIRNIDQSDKQVNGFAFI